MPNPLGELGVTYRYDRIGRRPSCAFCPEPAMGTYQTSAEGCALPGGWIMRTPLCSRHEQLLYDAGEAGRVYAGDGIRYWLLER